MPVFNKIENPKAVMRKKIRNHEKGAEVTVVWLLRRGAKDIVQAGFSGRLDDVAAEGEVVIVRA